MNAARTCLAALGMLIAATTAAAAEPAAAQADLDAALVRGVHWLRKAQQADGHWSLLTPQNDVGATALGLLALLHARPVLAESVAAEADQALAYLRTRQEVDGNFGMGYHHALATLALCEAYALTADPALRAPARKAVDHIIAAQGPNGGWRYVPRQDGDTSVTCWMLRALVAAERGGLAVPAKTWQGAAAYLDTVAGKDGGYGYTNAAETMTPRMTASGCLSRILLKSPTTGEHFQKSVAILGTLPPQAKYANVYYYFHATAVLDRLDAAARAPWRRALDELLLAKQEKQGEQAGSWPEAGDSFAASSGRVMTTTLSLMMLAPRCTPRAAARAADLKPAELAACWADLAAAPPLRALEAAEALAAARPTPPFLAERLRPAASADAQTLARLIQALDADRFATRQQAEQDLAALGEAAAAALTKALAAKPSLEVTLRLESLLQNARALTPERLRALRAVRVLERSASPDARALLTQLAGGDSAALLTQAAQEAVQRLPARQPE